MMKIMIMNGSPQKNGATGRILNRIDEIISQHEEVEVDYVNLADLQMEYCKGCEMWMRLFWVRQPMPGMYQG